MKIGDTLIITRKDLVHDGKSIFGLKFKIIEIIEIDVNGQYYIIEMNNERGVVHFHEVRPLFDYPKYLRNSQ